MTPKGVEFVTRSGTVCFEVIRQWQRSAAFAWGRCGIGHGCAPQIVAVLDESFLNLGEFNGGEVEALARALRERVLRWVGIPTA